jgi:formate dehydrogenase subunit delta
MLLPPYVRLANNVAAQFGDQPVEQGAAAVAGHLHTFWEPRMLKSLLAHVDAGADGLDPLVVVSVELLRPRE